MSPQRRKDYMKLCAYALAFIVLVGMAMGTRDTRHEVDKFGTTVDTVGQTVDQLTAFSAASRESRIEFQARETFLLCSRDPSKTLIPGRSGEVEATCKGYETMESAIRTERAKQAAARPPG